MDPIRILRWEMVLFLSLLAALLAYRMLTRKISLSGLLKDGPEAARVSPERVQLLIATLVVSQQYLRNAIESTNGALPDVSPRWLILLGASGGVYASVKAAKMLLRS